MDYKKKAKKRLRTNIILTVLLIASIFASPIIGKFVGGLYEGEPLSVVTEEVLGRKKLAITDAILGQARDKKQLVVMEQDCEIKSEISTTLADMDIFKKSKTIYSYATGVYTVDLSMLDDESITVDAREKTVKLTIPHCLLGYIDVDVDKTKFETTKKGFLAIGDIKMSQEQQQVLNKEIDAAMKAKLTDESVLKKADELAIEKVREVFLPLVEAVSADYTLEVVFN